MIPFWSACTDAYVKKDIKWINNMTRKLIILWLIFCFGTAFMVLLSNFIYKFWIGETIIIPIRVSVVMAIYVCIGNWNGIFYTFNLSVSKVYIQIWLSLAAGIVFIPLAFGLSNLFGLAGIPAAIGLSILPGSFISPVQLSKLINGKAKGIWNK
jgi:hypothetical protein